MKVVDHIDFGDYFDFEDNYQLVDFVHIDFGDYFDFEDNYRPVDFEDN